MAQKFAESKVPRPKDFLGRPRRRGEKATASILVTVLTLCEEVGCEAVTVEKIAARSGVAKTTIYRRWPNVSAIIMDAFVSEVMKDAPVVEKETAKESFTTSMKLLVSIYNGRYGQTLRTVIGRAQTDTGLRSAVETLWVEPRRKVARSIIQHGIERGELRDNLDPDIVLDALYGAIYHRFLLPYTASEMSEAFIQSVVDLIFSGITAPVK